MRDLVTSVSASLAALILSGITVEMLVPMLGVQQLRNSKFIMVLCSSLVYQTVIARSIVYSKQIQSYSEGLANSEIVRSISTIFGGSLTSVFVCSSSYFIGFSIVLFAVLTGVLVAENSTYVMLGLTISLMVDPLIAFMMNSNRAFYETVIEIGPVVIGYSAILLIGVGAIPVENIEAWPYPYLLGFCWASARMAFLVTYAFDRKQNILVFGPSLLALFWAVVPNLNKIIDQL
jgi:hypothetical protein